MRDVNVPDLFTTKRTKNIKLENRHGKFLKNREKEKLYRQYRGVDYETTD